MNRNHDNIHKLALDSDSSSTRARLQFARTMNHTFSITTHIVPFLSGCAKLTLSQTNTTYRAIFHSLVQDHDKLRKQRNLQDCVDLIVLCAQEKCALCEILMKSKIFQESPSDQKMISELLVHKLAYTGHCDIACFMGRFFPSPLVPWSGEGSSDEGSSEPMYYYDLLSAVLTDAARACHRKLFDLACGWAVGAHVYWLGVLLSAASSPQKERARDMCILVRERSSRAFLPADINMLLSEATRAGNKDVCSLAHEWGADHLTEMLIIATSIHRRDLCELAHDWIMEDARTRPGVHVEIIFGLMMCEAAYGCDRELCELARRYGMSEGHSAFGTSRGHFVRGHYEEMLYSATRGPYESCAEEFCILANTWARETGEPASETIFSQMLTKATRLNRPALCALARKFAMEENRLLDFNAMLFVAMDIDNRELCIRAHDWGLIQRDQCHSAGLCAPPMRFNRMLRAATCMQKREFCELARTWIYEHRPNMDPAGHLTNFDIMLREATRKNNRELCILARSWGATNFDEMLRIATWREYDDLAELAREWKDHS